MGLFGNHTRVGASAAGDYEIEKSLRFNTPDDAYLTRTPSSAGNRRTWTFSFWFKRTNPGVVEHVFSRGTTAASPWFFSYFDTDNRFKFWFLDNSESVSSLSETNMIFRDSSAWYHLVMR